MVESVVNWFQLPIVFISCNNWNNRASKETRGSANWKIKSQQTELRKRWSMPSNFECIQSGETACGDINILNNGQLWLRGRCHKSGWTSSADFQSKSLLLWTEQREQGWFAFHLGNWWNSLKYSRSQLVRTGIPTKSPLPERKTLRMEMEISEKPIEMDMEIFRKFSALTI